MKINRYYFLAFIIFCLFLGADQVLAATLSLSPSSGSYNVGDIFTVEIILDTEGAGTGGVDIHYLNYNPSLLEVQDEDATKSGVQILPGNLYPNTNTNLVNSSLGKIDFSQTTAGGNTYQGKGLLSTIRFKVLNSGSASVTFNFTSGNTTDTNVAFDGQDLLTAVVNGSYTLTTPPAGGGGAEGDGGGATPPIDTTPPSQPKNFQAQGADKQITLSWQNPTESDFDKIVIFSSTSSISANITYSSAKEKYKVIYEGTKETYTDTNLDNTKTYYYAIYAYDKNRNYSLPVIISAQPEAGKTVISPPVPPVTDKQILVNQLREQLREILLKLIQLYIQLIKLLQEKLTLSQ